MLRSELVHQQLSDLRLRPTRRADSALTLDRRATIGGWDLDTQRDLDAIGQAAWLALAVPRGALAPLGHPDFGSRLHSLIGEILNDQTIARARAYIREALRHDPRFNLRDVSITRPRTSPDVLEAQITLDPDIQLVFPLTDLISAARLGEESVA